MHPFDHIVEERLRHAEDAGELRGLPGSGRPLQLEDVSRVPDELRASYLLLKSNGFLPPELEAKQEWLRLEDLLRACTGGDSRARLRADVERARSRYRQQVAARSPHLAALAAGRGVPA
ncbi:MAG: DnaJ family domain-containing protein [Planctomycetota bacterium]